MHGARLYVSLPGCYIATVNESETITVAQEFCQVRTQARGLRGRKRGFPAEIQIGVDAGALIGAQIGAQICTNVERS